MSSEHKLKVYKKWYDIILTSDETDGGFVVTVKGIPECIDQGDTVEECLKNIRGSIMEHLAGIRNKAKEAKMTARERYLHWKEDCEEKQALLDTSISFRDIAYSEWTDEIQKKKDALKAEIDAIDADIEAEEIT